MNREVFRAWLWIFGFHLCLVDEIRISAFRDGNGANVSRSNELGGPQLYIADAVSGIGRNLLSGHWVSIIYDPLADVIDSGLPRRQPTE